MTATYREVLHPPLTGQTAIDACSGELGRVTAVLVNPLEESKLTALRRYHRERLQREFEGSSRDQDWFRRHEGLP